MRGVFACNQYIDAQAPWALRKTDPERMHAVLRTLVRAIRDAGDRDPAGGARRRRARCSTSSAQTSATMRAIDDDGWYDRAGRERLPDRAAERRCSRGWSCRRSA